MSAAFTGIDAVAFDGDGTLWDFESSMRAALALSVEALTAAGVRHRGEPVEVDWLAAIREEVAAEARFRGADMGAIRLAAFEEAIRRCDPARLDLAQPLLERYMADRFAVMRPYPDAVETLTALEPRFRLGYVTNGNTHPSRLGLDGSFAAAVLAAECGLMKPDPGIYALAAERLGVEPGACLHVGDHALEDVDAARRAGMRTVWLNREGGTWPSSLAPADAEIGALSELPGLLSAA